MIKIFRPPVRQKTVEGVVDDLARNILRGWACTAGPNQPPLHIEVRSGGQLLASAEADAFRGDLAAAGKREGHCAFQVILDPLPPPGSALVVTAIDPDGGVHILQGNPVTVPQPTPTASPQDLDVLPLPIAAAHLCGSLDQCGPARIRGWTYWLDSANDPVSLSLVESGRKLLRLNANQWRSDLAELRQGDGCCGFDALLPDEICDGHVHTLDLLRSDTNESVLTRPFRVRVRNLQATEVAKNRTPASLQRSPSTRKVTLSVIVNFYNMHREAERTLTSLSRSYQNDADDFEYEVLCIDNGSNPPLDPQWIERFGPQFRLIRPSRQLASPCAAINEAALQAQGDYLAIMIDGAHLLTPGVFQQARQAWREHADAVVAIRHWFIGGDQRWLAVAGYTQQMEDRLFERIQWPNNGYELFRISAPIGENPEPWLDDLSESNCLMLPTALYDRIGGIDEAFDQAGGGFANLDLWRRASDAASGPLVSLVGEASFHQFHGGTTTNVEDAEKDIRVRAYANAYRVLRGEDYVSVHRSRLVFRGNMQSEFATGVRQRSLIPMRLGITEQVRPGQLPLHFDEGAQTYLQSVYAECGLQHSVSWMGQPTGVAPADLINFQEIIHQLNPDAIVTVGVEKGLLSFIDTTLSAMANLGARILCINPASKAVTALARVTYLDGSPEGPQTLATVRHWIGTAENVLVLYTVGSAETFTVASLQAYGDLVSYRSYLVCLGTLFGQPWLGYSHRQPLQTIRDFTRESSSFVIDRSWNRQLISTCPSGYLRKISRAVTAANYGTALDEFAAGLPSQENS